MAKAPFLCKYDCGTYLGPDFDKEANRYLETDTGELHGQERCQAIKTGSIRILHGQKTKAVATPATAPNPIQKAITESTPRQQMRNNRAITEDAYSIRENAKAEDIKKAQRERLRQHNQLMRAMINLYKIIELDVGVRSSKSFQEIRDLIDFQSAAGDNMNDPDPDPSNLDYEQ